MPPAILLAVGYCHAAFADNRQPSAPWGKVLVTTFYFATPSERILLCSGWASIPRPPAFQTGATTNCATQAYLTFDPIGLSRVTRTLDQRALLILDFGLEAIMRIQRNRSLQFKIQTPKSKIGTRRQGRTSLCRVEACYPAVRRPRNACASPCGHCYSARSSISQT